MKTNHLSRRQFLQWSAMASGALALSACAPSAAPAGGDKLQPEGERCTCQPKAMSSLIGTTGAI